MNPNEKTNSNPIFFMFEDEKGWKKTDKQLTYNILAHLGWGKKLDCAGRSFYPQWEKPTNKNEKKVAWRVDPEGQQMVRWSWLVRKHEKSHGTGCKMLNGKQCAIRVANTLRWDEKKQFWVLDEREGIATETESERLDKKLE